MKVKKNILLVILLLIISIIFTETSSAIPKSETAVVDILKVYWSYNQTSKEQKRLETMKKEMLQNINPLSNDIKRLKSLIDTETNKKVKYDYIKEYFLLNTQLQAIISQYNSQLMTLEGNIRKNLLSNIWSAIETYSKLKGYNYVFKAGKDDVVAYDKSLDITGNVINFLNTVPNASELSDKGQALAIRSSRLSTGSKTISINLGQYVTVLYDPENVLLPNSSGKKFTSEKAEYNITAMYQGEIGLVPVSDITTNLKTTKIDLKLGPNYTTYIGFENSLYTERQQNSNINEITIVKIPFLYIERKDANPSIKRLNISNRNLRYIEISEIKDMNKDGIPELLIYYTSDTGSYLRFSNVTIVGSGTSENVNVNQISPMNDFLISVSNIPRYTNSEGQSIRTIDTTSNYYTLESDGTLVFPQLETKYYLKPTYTKEANPYRQIKPIMKKIYKYQYLQNLNRYNLTTTEGPYFIERGFTKAYAPVYKALGDFDHIAEIRKNDVYYIESAISSTAGMSSDSISKNDLWLRIIMQKTFKSEDELIKAGFPQNPRDSIYFDYTKDTSGNITIKFYAYLHSEGLNMESLLVNYLGLPFGVY